MSSKLQAMADALGDMPPCDYCGRLVYCGPPCCKFTQALADKDKEKAQMKGCWAATERGLRRQQRRANQLESDLLTRQAKYDKLRLAYAKAIATLEKLGYPQVWMDIAK